MARNLNKIVVVDVESTCWETKTPNQQNEIIEIGVCVVNLKKLEIEDNKSILVLPKNSEISEFCTQLTTLTQEMVDRDGISFADACRLLKSKYNVADHTWASWGNYDRRQFERQCSINGIKYPFGPTHLNVKNLFAIQYNLDKEVGMDKALNLLELSLDGTHHRGIDDARNIARILCFILGNGRRK